MTQHQILRRQMLRFAIATSLTLVLAVTLEWPFSFASAIFVSTMLQPGKPDLNWKLIRMLSLVVLACFAVGVGLVMTILHYPIVMSLMLFLLLLIIFYKANQGMNELVSLFLLISVVALPLLALVDPSVSVDFSFGFTFAFFVGLVIATIFQQLMPVPVQSAAKKEAKKMTSDEAFGQAKLSAFILMPLLLMFYFTDAVPDLMVVIFVAILAQNPQLTQGTQASVMILITNILGGLLAIVLYNLLVAVPNLVFFSFLMLATFLILAQLIFLWHKGALIAASLSALIVIIGSTTGTDGIDVNHKFYTRIGQLTLVGIYIVSSFWLANKLREERNNNKLRKQQRKTIRQAKRQASV